ncbi:MAG: hypothetical protein GX457_18385 [Thermotogaceae bacterium]|nr:hypothetical protein [Thermotogaceae bacterium]
MKNKIFNVVYVINEKFQYQKMAVLSALTLRIWNKEVEIIFVVCGSWHFPILPELHPYKVIHKSPIIGLFPLDKVLLTELEDLTTLLYLDADTVILKDIHNLLHFTKKDLSARLAWVYQQQEIWNSRYDSAWRKVISITGLNYIPILNSGVMLFQNGSHLKIRDPWNTYMKRFLQCELPQVYGSFRHYEQLGLALAISEQKLSVEIMPEDLHGFGWVPEPPKSVVYHLASKHYSEKINSLLFETGLLPHLEQMPSFHYVYD